MTDRRRGGFGGDDRAVSEAVGFVLVVSLILLSVSLVSVFGLSTLQDARDAERVDNSVRAFDVLADNVEDVYTDGAPARATEIKLDEASVSVDGATTLSVTVGGTTYTETVTPVVMRVGDTAIVYEGTAVLRVEDNGGVAVVDDPAFTLRSGQTLVPLVVTQVDGRTSIGGTSTILVETERVGGTALSTADGPVDVQVEIQTTPERAPGWARAVEAELPAGATCAVSGGTVTCPAAGPYATDEVVVSRTTVNVTLLD